MEYFDSFLYGKFKFNFAAAFSPVMFCSVAILSDNIVSYFKSFCFLVDVDLFVVSGFFHAYFLLILTVSLYLSSQKHLNIFNLIATFIILHMAYGIGTLCGFLKISLIHRSAKWTWKNWFMKKSPGVRLRIILIILLEK